MGKVLYALLVLTRANNHHMHLVNCSVSSGPPHETLVQSIYIQPTTNNPMTRANNQHDQVFQSFEKPKLQVKAAKTREPWKTSNERQQSAPKYKKTF